MVLGKFIHGKNRNQYISLNPQAFLCIATACPANAVQAVVFFYNLFAELWHFKS